MPDHFGRIAAFEENARGASGDSGLGSLGNFYTKQYLITRFIHPRLS